MLDMIEPLCKGKTCLVVGSGPNFERPLDRLDIVLGANGGASLANADVLCTTSYLFRPDSSTQENKTKNRLGGLDFTSTWLDVKCHPPGYGALSYMDEYGIGCGQVHAVEPNVRAAIVLAACGKDLWVSTGVWAICLALMSQASIVHVTGISLDDGHVTDQDNAPRQHLAEDKECLQLLTRTHHNLVLQESLRSQL